MISTVVPLVALGLGAIFFFLVAVYVFRHRGGVGANALISFLLAAGFWSVCHGVEVSLADPQMQELLGDIKYLGVVSVPPSVLVFAMQYTGRSSRLALPSLSLLLVEPLTVLGLLFSPTTHDLVRSVPDDAPYGAYYPSLTGPIFIIHAAYSYALVLVATTWLTVVLLRVSRTHKLRSWVLIGVCCAPLLLNLAYVLGVFPLDIDPTPFAFLVAAFVLVWGFFRFRLNEMVPVARRQVVDRIPDAVLVLDSQGRVMDANPAAARLTGHSEAALVGRDVVAVLPQLRALADGTAATEQAAGTCRVRSGTGQDLDLAVTISPLPDDRADPTGRLVVLRDITVQRDVERRLRELVRERSATIETLRRGLYPVNMPAIPGVQVAAILDPAEAETSIGGDFLDVRPMGHRTWTLMVGDVVGKGAGAATLTALARHTTVALAALGWSPARVLRDVSRAIATDEQAAGAELDARFCTIALANLTTTDAGATLDLALGGHPQPMVIRADGQVQEVGVPGSLLGVLPDPDIEDVTVQLSPGDSLLMFTDGVIEARNGSDAFGERRLAELASALVGLPAPLMAREIVDAVRSFGTGADARDDVAVVVLTLPVRDATGGRLLRRPGRLV